MLHFVFHVHVLRVMCECVCATRTHSATQHTCMDAQQTENGIIASHMDENMRTCLSRNEYQTDNEDTIEEKINVYLGLGR